jgi:DNA adenine methylase
MPTYQGGKARLGRRIHDVIIVVEDDLLDEDEDNLRYLEPFVGMGGVLKHFGKDDDRDMQASDASPDIVMMWQSIQDGWVPPLECSEKCYNTLKHAKPSAERGFIGSVASWGGNWFRKYRLNYQPKNRNYLMEGHRSIMNMKPFMYNVEFISARSYDAFKPDNMLIYCDPPYKGNKLGNSDSLFRTFDHDKFWDLMRKWSKNNIVIVSESTAPKDFKKIWSAMSSISTSTGRRGKKYKDNLYLYKSTYDNLSSSVKREIKSI